MPQILTDTAVDSAEELFATAEYMIALANIRLQSSGPPLARPHRPDPQPLKPAPSAPIGPAPAACPPAPLPPDYVPLTQHTDHGPRLPDVPAGTLDPAVVFQQGAVVSPSVPAAPAVPTGFQVPPGTPAVPATASYSPPVATGSPPHAAPPSVTHPTTANSVVSAAGGVPNLGATAQVPASDERDADGILWDARVHSDTKKKNADGRWRMRRNLDETVKNSVYAELKASAVIGFPNIPAPPSSLTVLLPQPPVGVPGSVPMPPAPPAVPVPPPTASAVPLPPVPAVGTVPAPPAPFNAPTAGTGTHVSGATSNVVSLHPPVPVSPTPSVGLPNATQSGVVSSAPITGFRELLSKINNGLAAGRITQDQITEACKSAGLDGVGQLAVQPAKVPEVDQYLNRWLSPA